MIENLEKELHSLEKNIFNFFDALNKEFKEDKDTNKQNFIDIVSSENFYSNIETKIEEKLKKLNLTNKELTKQELLSLLQTLTFKSITAQKRGGNTLIDRELQNGIFSYEIKALKESENGYVGIRLENFIVEKLGKYFLPVLCQKENLSKILNNGELSFLFNLYIDGTLFDKGFDMRGVLRTSHREHKLIKNLEEGLNNILQDGVDFDLNKGENKQIINYILQKNFLRYMKNEENLDKRKMWRSSLQHNILSLTNIKNYQKGIEIINECFVKNKKINQDNRFVDFLKESLKFYISECEKDQKKEKELYPILSILFKKLNETGYLKLSDFAKQQSYEENKTFLKIYKYETGYDLIDETGYELTKKLFLSLIYSDNSDKNIENYITGIRYLKFNDLCQELNCISKIKEDKTLKNFKETQINISNLFERTKQILIDKCKKELSFSMSLICEIKEGNFNTEKLFGIDNKKFLTEVINEVFNHFTNKDVPYSQKITDGGMLRIIQELEEIKDENVFPSEEIYKCKELYKKHNEELKEKEIEKQNQNHLIEEKLNIELEKRKEEANKKLNGLINKL